MNMTNLKIHTIKKTLVLSAVAAILTLSGCATTELLDSHTRTTTKTKKTVKFSDQVLAFGKPASKLPNMPNNSIVIVGDQYSYVISEGSTKFVNLISRIDPRYFNLERELSFESVDGKFGGSIDFSYVKLKSDFTRSDLNFFLQNQGEDCTTSKDERIDAQRFCFSIDVQGAVYPRVNNYNLIKSNYTSLSKPYKISVYTKTTTTQKSANKIAQKMVLLPFALAFDVVTLPLQILE